MDRTKKRYQDKKISLFFLCIVAIATCVLFLTLGFSSIQDNLEIDGTRAIVRVQKDIRITDITLANYSSNAASNWEEHSVSNISSEIILPNSDSTVTYNVKVTNIGNIEASVSDITVLPSNLTYTVNNYQLRDMMCDDNDSTLCKLGSETTLSITIGYAENGYDSTNTNYTISMNFTFSYAVDSVAIIGNSLYDTLQQAINAVPTDNTLTTIKLLNNTSEIITVARYKNIIFDLNGKTIRNSGNNPVIANNGTIEITNGIISSNAATNGAINNEQYGTLTISSGRVIVTGGRQALYNNKGVATITGSAYLSSSATERAAVQNLSGGTLTITGGTIVSTGTNAIQNAGTMTVGAKDNIINKNSPIIQGKAAGIYSSTNYNFYDGTAKGKTLALDLASKVTDVETGYSIISSEEIISGELYKIAYLGIGVTVTFNPNGGSVSERTRTVETGQKIGSLPTPTRTGYEYIGWFTESSGGQQISSDTIITQNVRYYAQWNKLADVVQIGDTMYASITEAISNVPNNTQTTIKLLKDTSDEISITANKNIIIDLNGKTLSNSANKPIIENAGTLSIINGSLATSADQGAINNTAGSLIVNDTSIIATGNRQAIYITGGVVTISGNSYLRSETSGIPTGGSMERGTVQVVSGTLNVLGGTIIGNKQQAISNQGTLTIGVKDGSINSSAPVLIGKVHGVRSTGTFNFYDGIIKGMNDAIDGNISDQETNSNLVIGTETIDSKEYITAYLED